MTKKILLGENDIPERWYNILPDMPAPPAPYLNPQTLQPMGPADLAPIFPQAIIAQEVSAEPWIEIPDEVREVYKIWRPSPLYRADRLEKALDTPAHIYFKYEGVSPAGSHKPNTAVPQAYYNAKEGVKRLTTETGAGQWGSALAFAGALFGLEVTVYMVKVSYEQKPYRRAMMETWGAKVYASPTDLTNSGRGILAHDPDSPGSLGIAISEAVEDAATHEEAKYSLGSVVNHVLLHQTVMGLEAQKQMEMAGEYPDVVIACVGGGSNFAGLTYPFIGDKLKGRQPRTRFVAAEPAACPTLTRGVYAFDFGDAVGIGPVVKMYTLGHSFVPDRIHSGGLRYHGDAPSLCALVEHKVVDNRTECVVETLRHALNVLAVVAPEWLQSQVQPEWLERYGPRASEYRFPSGTDKRQQFERQVGQDGWGLLAAIKADTQSHWMLSIPAIDTLQRVWKQDYLPLDDGGTWIADQDRLEAAKSFYSPYDLDASAAKKRSTYWIGYKVHFTETCDEDLPRLITHVVTDIGPIPDREALPEIHAALQQQELLPEQHLVDAGYVDAESLVVSQTAYQVDLVGPTAQDYRWQAREQNGYALTDFSIDWEHEQARCPQGQTSSSWTPTRTRNQEVIKIKFGYATCGACPVRAQCTQSRQRTLTVRRREAYFALEAARQRERTEEFAELYAGRAGIEGVHAQGVRRMGLRRSRYIGEPRTHLQHVVTAAAINVCRLHDWLTGVSPHLTPLSHFERFMKKIA